MENKVLDHISDTELEKVTGGGTGNTGASNITFKTYSVPQEACYYAAAQPNRKGDGSFSMKVIYVYSIRNNMAYFTEEDFIAQSSKWISTKIGSNVTKLDRFGKAYPYVLNVKP